MYELAVLFMVFIIYSMLGFFTEILFRRFYEKEKFSNRGFLIGPYLPIYGICCIIMVSFPDHYIKDPLNLFVMAMFLCASVEYFTSLILEKIFKVRWWDYSKRKFNINGRICLENVFFFGTGGLFVVYVVNPLIMDLIYFVPTMILLIITLILFVVFISDLTMTIIAMVHIKLDKMGFDRKDATVDIKRLVSKALPKTIFFTTRILNAFPDPKELADVRKHLENIKKEVKLARLKKRLIKKEEREVI